jgi:hypothetical protein
MMIKANNAANILREILSQRDIDDFYTKITILARLMFGFDVEVETGVKVEVKVEVETEVQVEVEIMVALAI